MKQTTFSCPFSRSCPPLLFHCGLLQDPSRPEEKPQPISQTQDSQKAEVRLNLSPARGAQGRGARPDAPAARRRDGPRRNLPPHASRVAGLRCGPDFARLHCGSASRFPSPSTSPRAQSPASDTALALRAQGSTLQDARG